MKPEGPEGVDKLGHREYVGGLWHEMGKFQLDLMTREGLSPTHCLLDIACGSLRAGRLFIEFLDQGLYLGIDKESLLIERGIADELSPGLMGAKRPEFVVSDAFEFRKFSKVPQFSIAQSLFSHLAEEDIRLCLANLRDFVKPGHKLVATFFPGEESDNLESSHSHAKFCYRPETMVALGESTHWVPQYVGDFGHPRGQHLVRFVCP